MLGIKSNKIKKVHKATHTFKYQITIHVSGKNKKNPGNIIEIRVAK